MNSRAASGPSALQHAAAVHHQNKGFIHSALANSFGIKRKGKKKKLGFTSHPTAPHRTASDYYNNRMMMRIGMKSTENIQYCLLLQTRLAAILLCRFALNKNPAIVYYRAFMQIVVPPTGCLWALSSGLLLYGGPAGFDFYPHTHQ